MTIPPLARRMFAGAGIAGLVTGAGYAAGFSSRSQWFGAFPYRADQVTDRRIALTFDDGPNEPYTSRLLDLLARHRAKATFFQVGRCAERFPSATRRVVEEGHQLGNHSYHHEFSRYLREPRQRHEIDRAQQVLTEISGVAPAVYRPPWLCHWPWVMDAVRRERLHPVSGTFCHPFEVVQPDGGSIARSALRRARPGAVLIFHDGFDARGGRRDQTVRAVELLLDRLSDQGYRFVTVTELLGLPDRR